jgi:alpha-L-fucosidase|eukprot:COSAG03_NODE_28_length_18724_cov_10.718128_22_plen_96_part_00
MVRFFMMLILTGCGFDLYPSNVSFPASLGGGIYNYTVRESPFKRDLLREFVDAARAAGIRPGVYLLRNTRTFGSMFDTVARVQPKHCDTVCYPNQ